MNIENNTLDRLKLKEELTADIVEAKNEIETAKQIFNLVYRPDEVDVYIYRLRAAEAQYDSLLKKLKELQG